MKASGGDEQLSIYHERQAAALCGVHSLNTLLQAPVFNEVELAEIGRELDDAERAVMAEAGVDTADFLRFAASDSGNVAADGNFSEQVLSKALERWGLRVVRLSSPEGRGAAAAPLRERAFICNLQLHWFTIVRLGGDSSGAGGEWFNCNSLLAAPQRVTDGYLSVLIAQLIEEGYTIFAVRGAWPGADAATRALRVGGATAPGGRWWPRDEAAAAIAAADRARVEGRVKAAAEAALERAGANGGVLQLRAARVGGGGDVVDLTGLGGFDDDDPQLAAALAASLADAAPHALGGAFQPGGGRGAEARGARAGGSAGSGRGPAFGSDDDGALQAAIAASLAEAAPAGGGAAPPPKRRALNGGGDSDADLAAALAASLAATAGASPLPAAAAAAAPPPPAAEVPPEPAAGAADVWELAVRLPDGRRLQRRFDGAATVGGVEAWCGIDTSRWALAQPLGPPQQLGPPGAALAETGLQRRCALVCVPRRGP